MRKLTPKEIDRFQELESDLQLLFLESRKRCLAVLGFDIFLVCGHRPEHEQELAFAKGLTKLHWPDSKHNSLPSKAMDVCPFPINWDDLKRFRAMYGVMNEVAKELGLKFRFGADFNMDGNLTNDKFVDLPHVEMLA